MRADDFQLFQSLVRQRSGLALTEDKAYLLESRLMPIARKHGHKGLDEIAAVLRTRRDETLARDVVEAMTTNESSFFRDTRPFDQFRNVILPALMKNNAGRRQIRIWSAACSSGQEPYSLAMILDELKSTMAGWRVEILATDISREMLAKATAGTYTQFEVQRGLPVSLLVKHFKQDGHRWIVSSSIRSMVTFREFNLLNDPLSLGKFDIIFCRNVLIYFDQPTKTSVFDNLSKVLNGGGVLYLGGAETVLGVTDRFRPQEGQRGIYIRSEDAAGASAGAATRTAAGGSFAKRAVNA